ncbi:MAG TPA: hypothetical protein DF383_03195 [Deltaproteobacteria bacterium]|nr:hypothetical protein [Deltaproteobacteria bacterium]
MPLNWDDDEEDLTEIDYKKRPTRILVHDELTPPLGQAFPPVVRREPPPETAIHPPEEPRATMSRSPALGAYAPAASRDRFAAFCIDSWLAALLYWPVGYGLLKFFGIATMALLHQGRGRLAIHVAATLLMAFLYYVIMESVFGATLGKFFCRLRVIDENGESAALGSVFIRNLLRLVDYPFAFLIAVITMESSPLNQRFGDRAAKTLVIKKTRRRLPALDLTHTPLASTFSRLLAEAVDLLLALTLIYGLFLWMRPEHPLLSRALFLNLPAIFILYYTLLEFLLGSTPGKTLFKRQVVLENGEPPDGTGALLRNLLRPLDYLLGYPLMVLSPRKQRLGDMTANTLVVAKAPPGKAWLGSALAFVLVLLTAYSGARNPNNPIRKDYGLGAIQGLKVFIPSLRPAPLSSKRPSGPVPQKTQKPTLTSKQPSPSPVSTSDKLSLAEFYFATGPAPAQIRQDGIFRSGDLVFLFFKMQGFTLNKAGEVNLVEDLKVEDPEGKVILEEPDIVTLSKTLQNDKTAVLFANQVQLAGDAPLGKYRAVIVIRDQVAETQFSFEKVFELQ